MTPPLGALPRMVLYKTGHLIKKDKKNSQVIVLGEKDQDQKTKTALKNSSHHVFTSTETRETRILELGELRGALLYRDQPFTYTQYYTTR